MGVVVVAIMVGGYFYPKYSMPVGTVSTTNTTTFNSAKVAEVGFIPATAGATSTSILNTDSTDRVVIDSFYYCNVLGTSYVANTGSGLANLTFTAATTSTASPAALGNTALLLSSNVATTSAGASTYVSSSTTPYPDNSSRLWKSGSYMTFFSNATNTAQCVAGVHYLGS